MAGRLDRLGRRPAFRREAWSRNGSLRAGGGAAYGNRRFVHARRLGSMAVGSVVYPPRQDHGGNRMLEDKLLLVVALQHDGILVKRTDTPRQLDAAHEVDGDGRFVFPRGVQERVLDVLGRLSVHADLLFLYIPAETPPISGGRGSIRQIGGQWLVVSG